MVPYSIISVERNIQVPCATRPRDAIAAVMAKMRWRVGLDSKGMQCTRQKDGYSTIGDRKRLETAAAVTGGKTFEMQA